MKIDHIAMYVSDLEGAKDFFVKYFKAESGELYHNKATGFKSYFLSFKDTTRLEIMTRPELDRSERQPFSSGLVHLAFSTGSQENVDGLTRRLKEDGFEVISGPRTTGDGYYESCVSGFEGNLIEITV